jgi:hypothetical protein
MGIPLPCVWLWVPTYTTGSASIAPSEPGDYKDNDSDDNYHEREAGVKSGAENVTDQFATGHGEEHQENAQSNYVFHFCYCYSFLTSG